MLEEFLTKKISRRRFIIISGKAIFFALAATALPINKDFIRDFYTSRKRFAMKFKPFYRECLYQKHNWAG